MDYGPLLRAMQKTKDVPGRRWSSSDTALSLIELDALHAFQFPTKRMIKLFGLPVIVSRKVPDNEIHIVDDAGKVFAIIELGPIASL